MIETLRIRDLAIVERAELDFTPGLNVLTGETGAGKSIVLGALGLLAGGRSGAGSLRDGAELASVEAVFRTDRLADLERLLADRGLETDAGELVVRRTISKAGRSRAQLCGQLVPVSALSELFAGRIEVSSQHDSQSLLRREAHGRLLDRTAGLESLRGELSAAVESVRTIDRELQALEEAERERERRRDFLAFQVNEIDAAELDPQEIESLRADRARLAHAERLRADTGAALASLAGDPASPEDAAGVDRVVDATKRIAALERLDPALAPLAARLDVAQAELRDLALELERYLDTLDADPARLAGLDERLHRVEGLCRKYGETPESVLAFRDEAAGELAALEGAEARVSELAAQRARTLTALEASAADLSAQRAAAGEAFAADVAKRLRELALPRARFEIALEPVTRADGLPCGPNGAEVAEFLFSANEGEALQPLRKVGSGGELSRVLLALKNAARDAASGMVLVFDEVDAAIGGRAADRVGKALAELGSHHQVLCITHLPQIAAFAETHFRVEKATRAGRTRTRIVRVEGDDRVEEIARMAGGEKVGEATRTHARELLDARAPRPRGGRRASRRGASSGR